ncbi:MAG: SpoIIE family protein phosphatase [Candidatus Aminicenantes bacterium]|jgi:serine phosphatase RsbU (regulator of sigma subunit)/pSer/pThr/pTyr-binding forkhead associated (FHA) protein
MPNLFVYPKKDDSFTFPLKEGKISIGRSADNDIVILDPYSSGQHAFIYPKESNYVLRDNSSKNGTFLNGKIIRAETTLNKGDEILIGSTRIVFDQEISTNVEVTETPSSSAAINSMIQIEDILKKPDISTTIKATARPVDIEKMRLEHEISSVISEVSKALVLHRPLNELLDYIMDLIGQHLVMDRGILMLKEGNPPQFIPKVIRINNPRLENQKIQVSQSIINMAVNQNSSILTSDAQDDTRFKAEVSIINLNIHSAMCVPLWNNREIIGVIYSDRIFKLEQFNEEDLKLLTLLSNLAAIKIENAKLVEQGIEKEKMEKELSLASQIQKDFLPKENPKSEHFEIAGSNLPCYQVGGDYYDFIPIGPARIGITIADVSGKGVSASLLMASLRAALQSEVHPDYDMKTMVTKLNDFVHRSCDLNKFITFFFCELNKKTAELSYINAGHNPPVIIDSKGHLQRLGSSGFCLGMFPNIQYKVDKVNLGIGDTALLFTDGITECRNKNNEEFEEDRLIKLLKKNAKMKADSLIEKIKQELDSFAAETEQLDDQTIVVIKRVC